MSVDNSLDENIRQFVKDSVLSKKDMELLTKTFDFQVDEEDLSKRARMELLRRSARTFAGDILRYCCNSVPESSSEELRDSAFDFVFIALSKAMRSIHNE